MDDFKKTSARDAEVFDRKQQRQRKRSAVLKTAATAFSRRASPTHRWTMSPLPSVSQASALSILQEQTKSSTNAIFSRSSTERLALRRLEF